MGGRLRTRAELLAAWRSEAGAATAAANECAEAMAAVAFDAADPNLGAGPWTPDALVAFWAQHALAVQLRPGDPIPTAIRSAFSYAQALLWDGKPVPDASVLIDGMSPADDHN